MYGTISLLFATNRLIDLPAQGSAPSPYIGERVAYKRRNPNGIFDELGYFIKLL